MRQSAAQASKDEICHGVIEDEVGVGHEIARDGHVVDSPSHRECVHAKLSNAAVNERGARERCGVLGAKHDIKIVRPEVVAHPAEDEDPKVALDPVPVQRQTALTNMKTKNQTETKLKTNPRASPFEYGSMLVGFPRSQQGVSDTWQEDEEGDQKIAELAVL